MNVFIAFVFPPHVRFVGIALVVTSIIGSRSQCGCVDLLLHAFIQVVPWDVIDDFSDVAVAVCIAGELGAAVITTYFCVGLDRSVYWTLRGRQETVVF